MVRTTQTFALEALGPKLWRRVGHMQWPLAEADLERLLDSLPHAIVALDGVGRVVYAAGPWKSWLGWSPSELIGRTLDETLKPRRSPSVRRLAQQPRPAITREVLKRRDGGFHEFDVEFTQAPMGLEPIAALQVFRPVRRVRVSDKAGAHAVDPKLEILTGLNEVALVSDLDRDGVWLNRAAQHFFGIERPWVASAEFGERVVLRTLDPDRAIKPLNKVLEQPTAHRIETHATLHTGEESILEMSVTPASARFPAIAIVRDVSERHRVEANLTGHASQLLFLLDHLPVGILYFDENQNCQLANGPGRRLFQRNKREMVGQPAQELLSGSARLLQSLTRCSKRKSLILTSLPWHDEGTIRFLDWRFEPIGKPVEGGVNPVLVLIVDVTPRTLADQSIQKVALAAQSASKRKTQFLAGLSHDLRSPVNALTLQTDLLRGLLELKQPIDTEVDRLLLDMRQVLNNMTELLGEMLDLTRLDSGVIDDRPSQFALDDWLVTTLAPFEATASAKGVDFTWRVDQEGRVIRGDRVNLARVLGNLVGNAVKFTKSGSVDVRAEASDEGGLVLIVTDTGPGIAIDQRDRIFDEFEQISNPERDPALGSGLGLAICRRLVEGVGGQILVESTVGQGSTFTVRYPATGVSIVPRGAADHGGL